MNMNNLLVKSDVPIVKGISEKRASKLKAAIPRPIVGQETNPAKREIRQTINASIVLKLTTIDILRELSFQLPVNQQTKRLDTFNALILEMARCYSKQKGIQLYE